MTVIKKKFCVMAPLADEYTKCIQSLLDSGCNALEVADKLKVSESTVLKIAAGRPISYPSRKKIEKAISSGKYLKQKDSVRVKKLTDCYKLYRELGTLQAAANELGLTRERVRQLLVKGTNLKLFKYSAREYPYISKEKILSDYSRCLNKTEIAKTNKVSITYLNTLLLAYSINDDELAKIRNVAKKQECINQFRELESKHGRTLSTTDLQLDPKQRALYSRISRYWGSFDRFRSDNSIEKPLSCKMTFKERIQPWIDRRVQMATIRRVQDIDSIMDVMADKQEHPISYVATASNLDVNRVRNLLKILIRAGHIERSGEGFNTKYRLTP